MQKTVTSRKGGLTQTVDNSIENDGDFAYGNSHQVISKMQRTGASQKGMTAQKNMHESEDVRQQGYVMHGEDLNGE